MTFVLFALATGLGCVASVLVIGADWLSAVLFWVALLLSYVTGHLMGYQKGEFDGQQVMLSRVYGKYRAVRRHPGQLRPRVGPSADGKR
jgi:hypothetical protein